MVKYNNLFHRRCMLHFTSLAMLPMKVRIIVVFYISLTILYNIELCVLVHCQVICDMENHNLIYR